MARLALHSLTLCCLLAAPLRGPDRPDRPADRPDRPVDYLDPPQGQFIDDWTILELAGRKVGYAHATMSRDGQMITTRSLTYFKLARASQAVEISILQSTRETVAGDPLHFDTTTKMATMETSTRGRIDGDKVHITTSQFGHKTERTTAFPVGARMLWGMFRAGIEHGFTRGTTYDVDMYEPTLTTDRALKVTTVVGDRVTIDLLGKKRPAIKVTSTTALPAGSFDSVTYVDETGRTLRGDVNLAGMKFTMFTVDRTAALAEFDPPEFFLDTLVSVNRAIDPAAARAIRYTLRLSGDDRAMPELPATAMQKPQERTGRSAVVEVRRLDVAALKQLGASAPPPALRPYLQSSATLNIRDDQIVRMAKQAGGAETRPYFLADKLRRYVSDVIRDKNLNVGFATASEVCREREGDCSEHAVLLAALGRARGLPSRVAVGLAYVRSFAGRRNVFGFHMWTQFYIGDQWVDFDAALHESDCSPTRIALATSSLNDAGLGDIAFSIMDVISGLQIHIDDVESR